MTLFGPAKTLKPYPFQLEAIEGLRGALREGHKRIIFCLPTGGGKCLARGTKVMLYPDGRLVSVEDVVPGMALMGPDSQPRYVESVSQGYGPMVEVVPVNGETWCCNDEHVLTLIQAEGEIIDVSVRDWVVWPELQKQLYELFRVRVNPPVGRPVSPPEPVITERTGFDVRPVGDDHYYGFTLTGDGRYLLGDFTVTHNTECAAYLIQEAMGKRSRVAFVADRRTLVKQTSQRFTDYGMPHGIAMAGDTTRRNEPIQICSAQTLEKREWWPEVDLIVVDECHTRRKAVEEFAKEWGGPVIGLSATPVTKGLDETYSCVVNGATTHFLQDTVNPDTGQTYLAPLRIFPAVAINMTGAPKSGGEWTGEAVRERSRRIIGHIVSEWVRMTHLHFGGPVKTLLFTANVAHGNELCEMFQLAGYDFRQTTYRDSEDETDRLIRGFRRGDFIGLASVEKLAKGFDVPDVLCGIDARPNSSSLAAVIQKMGRVMRYSPGKEYALWLDHAENMLGWYDDVVAVWQNGVEKLSSKESKKKTRKEGEARVDAVCHGCGFVLPPGSETCPFCGRPRPRRRSGVLTVDGRLGDELVPDSEEWMADRRWVWRQMCRIGIDAPHRDEAAALKFAKAQYRQLYDSWSPWEFDPAEGRADSRVVRKTEQQYRQYKRRQKAESE